MFILGINAYHGGASACLIEDGKLLAAAEEERFERVKYWAGFPTEAIRYCLSEAGITAYDIDHVGISRNPSAHLYKKVLYTLSRRPSFSLIRDRLANAAEVRDPKKALAESLGVNRSDLQAEFHNVEHHRAHLASAFFVSPFEEAALLSVDGMGDFVSTMWGVGRQNSIEVMDAINFPHSLGWLYTALSQWLGFTRYGDEGKVMGLTAFGEPIYMDELRKIVRIQRDGTFELNMDYFSLGAEGGTMTWGEGAPTLGTLYSKKLVELLGPPREAGSEISEYHQNVAASLQAMLEEAEFSLVRKLQETTGQTVLCMAGGVALNSVFNGKVLPNTKYEDIYIQPAAGDAGTTLGAAYYIYHQILGKPRNYVMEDAFTGPYFTNGRIAAKLEEYGLTYEKLDKDELLKRSAEIVAAGNVLGWFQGRMEWGPRALGNRSIIADPRGWDTRDIINARIKHREPFRPFAPSVLEESVGDYFAQAYPDPFMLKVYEVLPHKRDKIPAVTHVDGTGRLQTVGKTTNPLYWRLIKEFEGLTGVPVVLNTSFNEREPIVCKPEEGIDCFVRTKMDALAIGDYLVKK
jgi:carbamoyltransferase